MEHSILLAMSLFVMGFVLEPLDSGVFLADNNLFPHIAQSSGSTCSQFPSKYGFFLTIPD